VAPKKNSVDERETKTQSKYFTSEKEGMGRGGEKKKEKKGKKKKEKVKRRGLVSGRIKERKNGPV